ncbi:MAG TPA: response regulator [Candidatus Omnitrophica bacterium]|nr:response regulator [Candidatus Omnitrophota bacterium]
MDKKKILIIDDEEGFTKMVKLNLEETGEYTVKIENNSNNAFMAAKEFKPDLILLDIMMPGMDGGDVASELKSDNALKDIPVVFLTAIVKEGEIDGSIGGHPFIAKPVSAEDLVKHIKKYIAK